PPSNSPAKRGPAPSESLRKQRAQNQKCPRSRARHESPRAHEKRDRPPTPPSHLRENALIQVAGSRPPNGAAISQPPTSKGPVSDRPFFHSPVVAANASEWTREGRPPETSPLASASSRERQRGGPRAPHFPANNPLKLSAVCFGSSLIFTHHRPSFLTSVSASVSP
ncbi:MAG: hypothetical protein RLZZ162_3475, partial [Verrucomicrobiota bacterium]